MWNINRERTKKDDVAGHILLLMISGRPEVIIYKSFGELFITLKCTTWPFGLLHSCDFKTFYEAETHLETTERRRAANRISAAKSKQKALDAHLE